MLNKLVLTIKRIKKRQIIIAYVLSLFFMQAIIAGSGVHYVNIRAGIKENYIDYNVGLA